MYDINFIPINRLLKTNNNIKLLSVKYPNVEYLGKRAPATKILKKILAYADEYSYYIDDDLYLAAFYLKNIILLQAFIDGNHRTAMLSVNMFLRTNHLSNKIKLPSKRVSKNSKNKMTNLINQNYQVFESFNPDYVCIIKDNDIDNECFLHCLKFVENNML